MNVLILILGLLLAVVGWIGVLVVIARTTVRHADLGVKAGASITESDRNVTPRRVARRHTPGWTIAFFIFFLLLQLVAFPFWQLVAFICVLSVIYGLSAISSGETAWIGRKDRGAIVLFGRLGDAVWYRALAVADWLLYLAIIVLSSALFAEVLI